MCAKVDKVYYKSGQHIRVCSPREVVSVDTLDIDKKYKILVAIDYFSRRI